jgi:peroxiredoxin
VGTRCGTTARYLGRLAALEQAYAGKVDFVYLYPNKTDSSEEKAAFHKQHALRGPMVDDAGAKIARQLGGERTAEVVLTRKDGVVVYRGAIDDNKDEANVTRKHLALAMDEHLAGKPVSQPKTIGTA